ncbi:MAG: DUF1080 domain-containing protein [Verrucomicrobiales bacterium]|nr:DUF1080 domain-containing protein [Verrucomicrobiales bacterium]
MKIYLFLLLFGAALVSPYSVRAEPNQLTAEESQAGFELIFGGKTFEGWNQSGNWIIDEEGAMFKKEKGGGISFNKYKVPDDFELRFEWKVAEKSNSGIYYRPTQYEYQILDNKGHSNGSNPRTTAASLYFGVAPSHDATQPVGEWNTGRIVGKGTVIQHWLNGEKVVAFDYTDPAFADHVDLLKKRGGDLTKRGAFLSLQDHGDPVWFRTIRIRELKADDEIDSGSVAPAEIPEAERVAELKKVQSIIEKRAKAAKQKAQP